MLVTETYEDFIKERIENDNIQFSDKTDPAIQNSGNRFMGDATNLMIISTIGGLAALAIIGYTIYKVAE